MRDAATLLGYLAAIRRWWVVVVTMTLLGGLLGFLSAPRADGSEPSDEPTEEETFDPAAGPFQATHILLRVESTSLTENLQLVLLLAGQGEIPVRVAEAVGRPEEALLIVSQMAIAADQGLGTVSMTATTPTPSSAEELATAYATELTAYFDARAAEDRQEALETSRVRLDRLAEQIDEVQDRVDELDESESRLEQAQLDSLVNEFTALSVSVRQLEDDIGRDSTTFETLQSPIAVSASAAELGVADDSIPVPSLPSVTSTQGLVLRIGLGALVGFLLGAALAFLVDRLDTRLRTVEDAEEAFGLPVLATLPGSGDDDAFVRTDLDGVAAHHALAVALRVSPAWQLGPRAPTASAEEAHVVGTASELPPAGGDMRAVLVTAAHAGEGTSTTVANLAHAYVAAGLTAMVVDCSFDRPSQQRLLDGAGGAGLRGWDGETDSLGGLVRRTSTDGLSVVTAGGPGAAPAVLLRRGHALVEALRALADVVILDAGPLLETNEAASLVGAVDGVLLVGRLDRTATRFARQATERLARLNAVAAGVAILSGARRPVVPSVASSDALLTEPAGPPSGAGGVARLSSPRGAAASPSASGSTIGRQSAAPADERPGRRRPRRDQTAEPPAARPPQRAFDGAVQADGSAAATDAPGAATPPNGAAHRRAEAGEGGPTGTRRDLSDMPPPGRPRPTQDPWNRP